MVKEQGRRSGHRWRQLRAAFLADCRARNAVCWLCLMPIKYNAPAGHRDAFEVDHVVPVSALLAQKRPDLVYDVTAWRPSHSSCNRARGDKPAPVPGAWVKADW